MKTTLLITILALTFAAQSPANTWESIGPGGGHFIGALTNPANVDEVIAVTSYYSPHTVYHSKDGGQTWSRGATFSSEGLTSARLSAFDFSRLYILLDMRCYYSKDSGLTWDFSTFPSNLSYVCSLCPHPTDPNILFAVGFDDSVTPTTILLKSPDGGKTWTANQTGMTFAPESLAVARSDPDILFMGGTDLYAFPFDVGMAKSIDGGKTWSDISDIMDPDSTLGPSQLAIDPFDEKTVYAGSRFRFYRTTDGGASWTHDDIDPCISLELDPSNTSTLYFCSDKNLFKSIDHGQTWTQHPNAIIGMGIDIHVAPASPSTVYVSTLNGGLFKSENGGDTWDSAHQGIPALSIAALAVAPSKPETLFSGLSPTSNLMVSYDSGTGWHEKVVPEFGGNSLIDLLFRSTNADEMMALNHNGGTTLYKSTDGGAVWSPKVGFDHGYCLAEEPGDSNIVYAAGGGLHDQMAYFKSTDAGATWSKKMTIGPITPGWTFCRAFAVAPSNASYLYAGGCVGTYISVWRNTGSAWEEITNNLGPLGGKYDYVDTFCIAPDDERTVLAGTTMGLFISTDAGDTWNATPLTVSVRDLAYYPAFDTLYAATNDGVHRSEDHGHTWQAMNTGLGFLDVRDIEVDTRNGYLFAGTFGASIWRFDLPVSSLWIGADEISAATGGSVDLELNAGADNAGRSYLVLGSYSGTKPGIPLPGGQATLPLNWDLFTDLVFSMINTPTFSDFMGKLDADGRATARINSPPIPPPAAVGVKLAFAYLLDHPFEFASNPVEVMILE